MGLDTKNIFRRLVAKFEFCYERAKSDMSVITRLSKWQVGIAIMLGSIFGMVSICIMDDINKMYRHILMSFLLILVATVDHYTYIIPDCCTVGGTILGLVSSGKEFHVSLAGGLVGYGIMLGIGLISKGGLGRGDIKLAFTIGVFVGWPVILPSLAISFFLAGTWGLLLIALRKKQITDYIPFGPFLTTGALATSLWGMRLVKWYLATAWIRV